MPSEHSRICKLHFISEKPSPFPNNPDNVPSKFSFTVSTSSRQRDKIYRYERLQARQRKRQSEPSLPRIESTEEVEVDSNVPEREQPEDTDGSNTQFGLPQVTERGELHHVEHLMEANHRVVTLEDELKVAKVLWRQNTRKQLISYTYWKKLGRGERCVGTVKLLH